MRECVHRFCMGEPPRASVRKHPTRKARARNPFGSGTVPWDDVERDGEKDLQDFIREKLAGLPTNE